MCGIVGYISQNVNSQRPSEILLQGLAQLEYRGYDSAGIALAGPDLAQIASAKKAGKLQNLREVLEADPLPPAQSGIGHTRWATHGAPTDINAHPHLSADGQLALIHNGIIENYASLREDVEASGIVLKSETDTEVVTHLLAAEVKKTADLATAMRNIRHRLHGTFTILALWEQQPDSIVAARRNSPLIIGLGQDEYFLASDVAAFIAETKEVMEVGQDWVVQVRPDAIQLWDENDNPTSSDTYTVDFDLRAIQKGGYDSFMEKEIHEQAQAISQTLTSRVMVDPPRVNLDELGLDIEEIRDFERIVIVACGTASYAGSVSRYTMERWSGVPCEVDLAHEFRYRDPMLSERTLVVVVSQSGETLDTIMALRYANEAGAKTLAVVNTQGSSIAREAGAVLYTHAGPEIAVASTKAFTAQLTALYTLALYLGIQRGSLDEQTAQTYTRALAEVPHQVERTLGLMGPVADLATELARVESVLFLGRQVNAPIAAEAALKLKELTYIHAEGFAAGELKHGPIALIEEGQLVVTILPTLEASHDLHAKVVSNIQEVKARGAKVIVVAHEGDTVAEEQADRVIWVSQTSELLAPFVTIIPLQVFSCKLASAKGLDVDQPRNLAKSVTVE